MGPAGAQWHVVTCLVGLVFTALVIALVADALRLRAPEARIVGLHRERALWARQRRAAASTRRRPSRPRASMRCRWSR